MRVTLALGVALLLGWCGSFADEMVFTKPVSTGPVRVEGRRILVEGKPFFLQGVGYQPIPIGQPVEFLAYKQPEIYHRDLAFLRSIGCNTLRTWAAAQDKGFLDACYNGGVDPIYLVTGPWLETGIDLGDPKVREAITAEWRSFIETWKDHPAILMWQIGNEYNYWYKHDILVFLERTGGFRTRPPRSGIRPSSPMMRR
jgi:beta-galactosidase/beta-glucuronidase